MSIESAVLEQFYSDINVTRARYAELITAEHELARLKALIHEKAKSYSCITHSELELIDTLFSCGNELTDDENTD